MELLASSGSIVYKGESFSGIYGHQCHSTGKWYVGESEDVLDRGSSYYKYIGSGQRLIKSAFKKYGPNDFSTYILERCDVDILREQEVYWSIKLDSMTPTGYNLKVGGGKKQHYSEQSKEKMRKSHTGKVQTEESKQKRREWAKNNYAKVASRLGKVNSKESNLKRSISLIGNKNNTGYKTTEQLLAYGNGNRGRKHSIEEIAKRSASLIVAFSKPDVIERLKNRKRPDPAILSQRAKEQWAKQKQSEKGITL